MSESPQSVATLLSRAKRALQMGLSEGSREGKIILDYQVGSVITRVHCISRRSGRGWGGRARGDVTTEVKVKMMCYEDEEGARRQGVQVLSEATNDKEQTLSWRPRKEPGLSTP